MCVFFYIRAHADHRSPLGGIVSVHETPRRWRRLEKVSQEPPLTKRWVGNGWNVKCGWTIPLTFCRGEDKRCCYLIGCWLLNKCIVSKLENSKCDRLKLFLVEYSEHWHYLYLNNVTSNRLTLWQIWLCSFQEQFKDCYPYVKYML